LLLQFTKKIGKQTAHEVIYEISMSCFEQKRDFGEMLLENRTVSANMSREEVMKILDPTAYTGSCAEFAQNVYDNCIAARAKDINL